MYELRKVSWEKLRTFSKLYTVQQVPLHSFIWLPQKRNALFLFVLPATDTIGSNEEFIF